MGFLTLFYMFSEKLLDIILNISNPLNISNSLSQIQGFSTANHIWAVKREMSDNKKDQDTAKDAKFQGIISDQGVFKNAFSYAPNTRMPV